MKFKITNLKKLINRVKGEYETFEIEAINREQAIEFADKILGHCNYACSFAFDDGILKF